MAVLNRVRAVWTGVAGSPAYTNLYSANQGITPAGAHAAAVALFQGFSEYISSDVDITVEGDVALVEATTDNLVGVASVPSATVVGGGSASRVPGATQILVRRLTGQYIGGRQVRGRIYLPYFNNGVVSPDGMVAAAVVTDINDAFNTYRAAFPNLTDVVYSRKNGVGVPVEADSVWTQFAVMRSRRD